MLKLIHCDICNPDKVVKNKTLYIDKEKFVGAKKDIGNETIIDLKGYTVYPALVNSHDHLLGTYLPKVGRGPYLNWKPWDEDLKNSSLYQERGKLSNSDIYELSYFRQILSGVTTVSDHIPHQVNDPFIASAPIRIVKNYALAHEASSYDLNWGTSLENEIKISRHKDIPFVTHLEEGYDEEAKNGVNYLNEHNGLYKNTVLVHCISCDEKDIALIARKKANIVWCPTSNIYMFDDTANVKTFLKHNVNVTLGTDSPMSGGLNMLEEMKFSQKTYKKFFKANLAAKTIFQMSTINGAKAFKLDKEVGSIEENKNADFIVIKNKGNKNPYDRIVDAKMEDIELVVSNGKVLSGKERYKNYFNVDPNKYQNIKLKNKFPYFVIGKPNDLKRRINKKVGFNKTLEFFPINV